MYTVQISKGVNLDKRKIFTLTYSNGVRTYTESFLMDNYVSADNVNQMANERITSLELEDSNYEAIVEGDITPTPPAPPTQEELDAQALGAQRQALYQAKQDLDLGLITQDDYDSQLSTVQTTQTSLKKASLT